MYENVNKTDTFHVRWFDDLNTSRVKPITIVLEPFCDIKKPKSRYPSRHPVKRRRSTRRGGGKRTTRKRRALARV